MRNATKTTMVPEWQIKNRTESTTAVVWGCQLDGWAPGGNKASVCWESWEGRDQASWRLAAAMPWGGGEGESSCSLHSQQLEEGVSAAFLPVPLKWERYICQQPFGSRTLIVPKFGTFAWLRNNYIPTEGVLVSLWLYPCVPKLSNLFLFKFFWCMCMLDQQLLYYCLIDG